MLDGPLTIASTVVAQLPDLPDPELGSDPRPYVILFAAGFVVGIIGHLIPSRTMVGIGILMVFMATILLPLVAALTR